MNFILFWSSSTVKLAYKKVQKELYIETNRKVGAWLMGKTAALLAVGRGANTGRNKSKSLK